MNRTKIEWVRNPDGTQGYTWNPITGCLNGCLYCYARRLANRRLKSRYLANQHISTRDLPAGENAYLKALADPFYPRFWPERLLRLPGWREPKGIFVCDMSDLFGIGIPEQWIQRVLRVIREHPWHRFYLLTKQPQNLTKFSPFSGNCWVGVSATTFEDLALATLHLSKIEAEMKFISAEPLLSGLIGSLGASVDYLLAEVDWLIIGAMTGQSAKKPAQIWVRQWTEAADKYGIPVFHKDNLENIFDGSAKRQEMPSGS